jgi:adenine-specific DNA-methyltransferase
VAQFEDGITVATSIPKSRRPFLPSATPLPSQDALTISYKGKRLAEDILRTPAAALSSLSPRAKNYEQHPNRLYYAENLRTLSALRSDETVRGRVTLVYIDPPFATGGAFRSRAQRDAYDDIRSGAQYVEFLRERLIVLHDILAEDGSIYVHLDQNMAFVIKLIMDEIFGTKRFRNWITRKKCNPKNYTSKTFGNISDYILFYSKGDRYKWNRPTNKWAEADAKEYRYVDKAGRRYMKVPVHAPGTRNGETGKPWRGKLPPPGKHWQYPPAKLDELDTQGLIHWSPTGNPRRKVYLDESQGVPVQDIWTEFRDAHNQNIKITGFPTEKNPDLLKRIIEASSDPGDLILDCFSGSGTTLAVASQLNRRWIGIDESAEAIESTLRRFKYGTVAMGDFIERPVSGKKVAHPRLFAGADQHHPIADFEFIMEDVMAEPRDETMELLKSIRKCAGAEPG